MEIEILPPKSKKETRISLPLLLPTITLEILASTVRNKHHKHQKGKHMAVFIHTCAHKSPNRFIVLGDYQN